MVNLVPVDRERHSGKGCRKGQGYSFAAQQAVVPLVGSEFAEAAVGMPIAFIEHSGRYLPVAVLSPVQGRNMFVSPTGQWLGSYVPAALRSYPFCLARVDGSDKVAVCVDEDSGLVVDAEANAPRFFEQDGTASAGLKVAIEFLQQTEQNRLATDLAVAVLAEARVIQPWPFLVAIGDQQVRANGLYRVDEAALNALDEETFLKLRKSSALVLAYSQLISTRSAGMFGQLAFIQQQLAQKPPPQTEASSLFLADNNGMIQFS
jgi:hypothetical protein